MSGSWKDLRNWNYARNMREAIDEQKAKENASQREAERAARNSRAIRQFLEFALFAGLAAAVLFKDEINVALGLTPANPAREMVEASDSSDSDVYDEEEYDGEYE